MHVAESSSGLLLKGQLAILESQLSTGHTSTGQHAWLD